jgi:hypothetical protein
MVDGDLSASVRSVSTKERANGRSIAQAGITRGPEERQNRDGHEQQREEEVPGLHVGSS